jgi:hypothetical protein
MKISLLAFIILLTENGFMPTIRQCKNAKCKDIEFEISDGQHCCWYNATESEVILVQAGESIISPEWEAILKDAYKHTYHVGGTSHYADAY